jgi:hypothetical protein
MAVTSFGKYPVIWGREEVFYENQAHKDWLLKWNKQLRQLDRKNLISLHNWPGQEPWRTFTGANKEYLDLVALQSDLESSERRMKEAFEDYGFAVYNSEIMPFNIGIIPGNEDQTLRWHNSGADYSSGSGLYYGLKDQSFPNHIEYEKNYKAISNPTLDTVLKYRNSIMWRKSPEIQPFDRPIFLDIYTMSSLGSNTFGYWETRNFIRPLPQGKYEFIYNGLDGNTTLRFRVFYTDFSRVDTLDLNRITPSSYQYFRSDGVKNFRIAFDILSVGAGAEDRFVRVEEIKYEKIYEK